MSLFFRLSGFSRDTLSRIVRSEHPVDFFEGDYWRVNERFDERSSQFDSQGPLADETGNSLSNLNSKPLCDFLELGKCQFFKDLALCDQDRAAARR